MADVVNLNRFRKRRERDAKAETAAQNRVVYGRTTAEREASAKERSRAAAVIDRHRIGPADDDDAS